MNHSNKRLASVYPFLLDILVISQPRLNHLSLKPPLVAYLEGRKPFLSQQSVDGIPADMEVICDFFNG